MSDNTNLDIFKQALSDTPMLSVVEEKDTVVDPLAPVEKPTPKKKDDAPASEPVIAEAADDDDEPQEEPVELSEIRTIAQHYAEKGILVDVEADKLKDLDDEAAFETIINSTVEARLNEYKEAIPDEAKYLLEYLEQGGDPRQYVEMMTRPDYSKISVEGEDNLANQKRVLRDYLSFQDYTPDQIERRIERYLDRGLLEEEAETALEQLVKAQAKEKELLVKQQAEQAKEEAGRYQAYLDDLKAKVTNKKDIAGFEIKPDQAKKLYDHMTKPVTKDGKTQFMLNYEKDPDAMLKVAYFDMIGWDFSKVAQQAETKVTKALKDKLKNKDTMTSMRGSTGNGSGEPFSAFKSLLK